ncbi:MAG: hypothetical protein IJ829_05345 [Kiritimatiellae bacterium]|nr:hypothetical protein [Kiritimatiellia bacterium]
MRLRRLTLVGLMLAPVALSAATTYYVSTTGSDDNAGTAEAPFKTVIYVLSQALADGDEVVVAAGEYIESGTAPSITAAITLRGASGDPADVTLTRWGNSYLFNLQNAGATVRDVTFSSKSGSSQGISSFTGGRIENCVFDGLVSSGYGGAISLMNGASAGACVVTNCVFRNCRCNSGGRANDSATAAGGAVYATGHGLVTDCRFIDNSARGGGGGIGSTSANLVVVGCVFEGNWSGHGSARDKTPGDNGWTGNGGAISCDANAGMTVSNCVFASNRVVLPAGKGRTTSCRAGGATINCNLYNCVLTNNYAILDGGAIYGGRAVNCLVAGNEAGQNGGGACNAALVGCTLAANTAGNIGGGTYGGSAVNSIVYGNTAATDANWNGTTFTYSCTTPAAGGTGNISSAPLFRDDASDWTLRKASPCIDAGDDSSAVGDADLAGESRIRGGSVDMGCYEADPNAVAEFTVAAIITGETFGYDSLTTSFSATVSGNTTGEEPVYYWDVDGDGSWDYSGTDKAAISHTYSMPGQYTVICTASAGAESDTATLVGAVTVGTSGPVYVNAAGSGTIPYDTAEKGATSISAALALLKAGGTVYVTNGTYNLSATVTISGGTKLVGCGTTVGDVVVTAAQYVRPFVLEGSGSVISGIRIQDTTAPNTSVASDYPHTGAAILVRGGTVTNCVFYNCRTGSEDASIKDTDNLQIENCGAVMLIGDATVVGCCFTNCYSHAGSGVNGGGAIQVNRGHGVIRGCDFYGNTARASGGAIHVPTARGATAEIWNCAFRNNQGSGFNGYGGAVSGGGAGTVLYNCLFEGNYVQSRSTEDRCSGGGVYNATLVNCTLVGNYIKQTAGSAGHFGAGVYKCAVTNSIVWANSNTVDNVLCNWSESDAVTTFGYSCTSPLADGTRNMSNDPAFVDGWRLSAERGALSPLIKKGLALSWMASATDLDGTPRLAGRSVDMGAYQTHLPNGLMILLR